jgi:hypothetical protein
MITESQSQSQPFKTHKGGLALRAKCQAKYYSNPKYCRHCSTMIPWEKNKNSFCNQSCAASYNNSHSAPNRKFGPSKKPKEVKAPYSTLYKCQCKHCGIEWRARKAKRICADHEVLYSHGGRAKYWFTFNVYDYPELFNLDLIKQFGWRSKTNPNGVSRDHRVSVNEAIKNNYNPFYIKHPLNCELMLFEQNNRKKTKSSIPFKELKRQIDNYEMVGRVGF